MSPALWSRYDHDVMRLLVLLAAFLCVGARGSSLFEASERGQADDVKSLLAAGADAELTDMYKCNAFFASARNGHAEIVRLFLERGANAAATRPKDRWTALHVAARCSSSAETVSLLIAARADPAAVVQADVPGREGGPQAPASVLDLARRGGSVAVIEAVEAALAAAALSSAGKIITDRNAELEPSARGLASAEARVFSADGAVLGHLHAGEEVCVRSIGPDWCRVVVDGLWRRRFSRKAPGGQAGDVDIDPIVNSMLAVSA